VFVGGRKGEDRTLCEGRVGHQPDESDLGVKDQSGAEIYVDIPFSRKQLDELIAPKLDEAIQSARETLEKAGLSPHDVERVVFVGGTDAVQAAARQGCLRARHRPSTDVNPMTAVAEGALRYLRSRSTGSLKAEGARARAER
jgi:molecular chaperone DnaK